MIKHSNRRGIVSNDGVKTGVFTPPQTNFGKIPRKKIYWGISDWSNTVFLYFGLGTKFPENLSKKLKLLDKFLNIYYAFKTPFWIYLGYYYSSKVFWPK